MSVVEYKVLSFSAAKAVEAPEPPWECWEELDDSDGYWSYGVWRFEDYRPVEFIGADGGEPEDQTLVRDWSWVAPALKAAYDRGANG